jgi:hypothetical protein
MASATYLSNPVVTINADLTDMCSAATLNHLVEALEDTSVWNDITHLHLGPCKQ